MAEKAPTYTAQSYERTDYADPPLDILEENFVRLILLSQATFNEVAAERGITLPGLSEFEIAAGPLVTQDIIAIAVEAREAEESESPRRLNIDRIQIDFTMRTGMDCSIQEQRKRGAALCIIIKRICRKLMEGGFINDLTKGWPVNSYAAHKQYKPPSFTIISLIQYPLAEAAEGKVGYSGGVRLILQAQYYPLKD